VPLDMQPGCWGRNPGALRRPTIVSSRVLLPAAVFIVLELQICIRP
jgi:hypothetical protein